MSQTLTSNGEHAGALLKLPLGTLELQNQIGMRISLNIGSLEEAYALMRKYGNSGWTSSELPPGGIVLPYDMADLFDFRLIGGWEWTSPEGEFGIMYRGQFYKKRGPFAPVDTKKMKMGAAIKYSRGGRSTDPPHLVEKGSGEDTYVTLATFKGAGKVIPALCKPSA